MSNDNSAAPLLDIRNLSKNFAAVQALSAFAVEAGVTWDHAAS